MFSLEPYSAEKFANRDAEVSLVRGLLDQLHRSDNRAPHPKVILFRGERGYGKTWLAFHLHRTVLPENNTKSLYLALAPLPAEYLGDLRRDSEWANQDNLEPEELCNQIMQWTCRCLEINYLSEPSLVEIRRALVDGVERSFNQFRYLVLILDSVFEVDWGMLETIERYFLAPLAEIPNVLFVMTGRGRPYPWISPTIRTEIQEAPLKEFSIDEIKILIDKYAQTHATISNATSLYQLGGQSPLVSYLFLQGDDPLSELDKVADYLLQVVPADLDRKRLREAFEAFCVLDGFRENEMEEMLKAYYEAKNEPVPDAPIRDLRDQLLRTHLFRWEGAGFHVDKSLRDVLLNYLKYRRERIWLRLNCAAYRIYRDYAAEYPQYQVEYQAMAKSYQEALQAANAWADCEKTVRPVANK